MAVHIAEFSAYLDREGANPTANLVSYRQGTLWLNPDELTQLVNELFTILEPILSSGPAPGRAPYLLSPTTFPTEPGSHDNDNDNRRG